MAISGHILDANCEALWRFNTTGGTVPDESAYGHTLTLYGSSASSAGQIDLARSMGSALVFGAATNYWYAAGDAASRTRMAGEVTGEAWIRMPSAGATLAAFSMIPGWSVPGGGSLLTFLVGSGYLQAELYAGPFWLPSAVPTPGSWAHIAARRRVVGGQGYGEQFLNGQLVGSIGPFTLSGIGAGAQAFWVGTNGRHQANTPDGRIDDMRISNIARTDAEILQSYRRGRLPDAPIVVSTSPYRAPLISGGVVGPITISGTAESGATVNTKLDGVTQSPDVVADSLGAWSKPIASATIGIRALAVTQTSEANLGPAASSSVSVEDEFVMPLPVFPNDEQHVAPGREASAADASFTGTDCYAFPDLQGALTLHSGPRLMADVLARRLTTRKGTLVFHPSFGIDIRDYLNDVVDDGLLFAMKSEIEAECENDERVLEATATLTYFQKESHLRLAVAGLGAEGPFKLVMRVTALDVTLLSEEAE